MVRDNDLIFDLDDVGLTIDAKKTGAFSKKEISVLTKDEKFPIFVKTDTPMFLDSATVIISTKVSLEERLKLMYKTFVSMTPEEFYINIVNTESCIKITDSVFYINIECPIASSKKLFEYVEKAKKQFRKQLVLMVGNVISPAIYEELKNYGVDYVRVGCNSLLNKKLGFYPGYGSLFDAMGIHKTSNFEEGRLRRRRFAAEHPEPEFEDEDENKASTITQVIFEGNGEESIDRIIKAFAFGVDYICIKNTCIDNIPEIIDSLEEALYISNSKNLEDFKSTEIYMISSAVLKA